MDLPRALSSWGPFLGIFPRDLAVSLGPVLNRLSFAVGHLQVRRQSGDGEPDGYDGLSRHGSYERLLASEWALAEEMPDEFLRRATMGEHLFLRVSRPVPAASRVSAAVFDAGPGQLGSPRIAQLAALIVLARRAEAAGVRFAWGILQEPDAPLFQEVTEASVLRLLQARTPHEATDAQVQAWHSRLQGWREADDLWFVGPTRLASVPGTRGASLLQIWDVLDPEARRVGVKVRRATGAGTAGASSSPSAVTLELPDQAACARLLRDPFSVVSAAPNRLAAPLVPTSDLLFASNGSKLFARAAGGGVVAFPVPNSARAPLGAPRLYNPWPGQAPAAVGLASGQVILASALPDGGVALSYASKKRGGGTPGVPCEPGEVAFRAGGAGAPLQPLFHIGLDTYLLDAEGTLFRLFDGDLLRLASRVSAAAFVAGHLSFVESAADGCPARITSVSGGSGGGAGGAPRTVRNLEDARESAPAFFGYGGRLAHPEHGLTAVEQNGGAWEIYSRDGRTFLIPFEGMRAVGVARDRERNEAGLLLLEDGGRTLLLAGLDWTRRLPAASAEIRYVTACPGAPWVAWSTIYGEVTVYSLDHDAVLLRRVPESEP